MNRTHLQWLYEELPRLIQAGVLSDDSADRLRAHYGELPPSSKRNLPIIVCSVLGAGLVGLGVVLLVAHNWEQLGRGARTFLAFAPLVLGQVLAGFTLWRRHESAAWREGSGVFLVCALCTCIALIGQTYHIPGNLQAFLLTCMLLSLPLIYLLDSVVVAAVYLVALPFWTALRREEFDSAFGGYILLAFLVLYLAWLIRREGDSARAITLTWLAGVLGAIALGFSFESAEAHGYILFYAAIFGVMYLAHAWPTDGNNLRWLWALRSVGAVGGLGLTAMLSFRVFWDEVIDADWPSLTRLSGGEAVSYILAALLLVGALFACIRGVQRAQYLKLIPGGLPFVVLVTLLWRFASGDVIVPALVFNVYLLALGVSALANGLREDRLLVLNWGLLVFSVFVVARFFDADLPFVLRGIAFILLGCSFLGANVWWLRKRKQGEESPA
jgi:uncharacterized membrane protein